MQGGISILTPSPSDVTNASNILLKAKDNYYITSFYNYTTKVLQFQLFYHDGNNIWTKSTLYSTSNVTIYKDTSVATDFPFNLTLSNSFAVATYITAQTNDKVNYSLRILQWDKNFNLLDAANPLVKAYESPIVEGNPNFNYFLLF